MSTHTLPTYFLSHGGGPWPWMKEQTRGGYDRLEASLQAIPKQLSVTPNAVLVISGHWEEDDFTVMSTPKPPMIYDYSGFPAHTYQIHYDALGSPDVAARVRELLQAADLTVKQDTARGFDHGTYAPLVVMYPKADVPVLQLSMRRGYDPQQHLALGRALAPLREEGVLIVGSGLSYHNLRNFGPAAQTPSLAFDRWLHETLLASSAGERVARLMQWADAPSARQAHPREDHLIPLMVAVGAAENEAATRIYHEDSFMGGVAVSSYRFGGV